MLRKTMLALGVLALVGIAAAQIIAPINTGPDQIAKGVKEASVDQTVTLTLPAATALHLAASEVNFDLSYLDGPGWEARATGDATLGTGGYACVYVSGGDVTSDDDLGSNFWYQTQVVPGGIAYKADGWDDVKLVYFGNDMSGLVPAAASVVTYPPIRILDNGELAPNSKDYFVCYQTFVIQLFSNYENFSLQVSRADVSLNEAGDVQSINHLYVQGNTCANFGAETGLYDLPNGETRYLLPVSLTAGPTGRYSSPDCNPNSSWMDVLGVLAVKVNADLYGSSTADLTYTLVSSDSDFTGVPAVDFAAPTSTTTN